MTHCAAHVEPLVNIVYILKPVCIYQPVIMVSIIRSVRVRGEYRFLCVVGSEEKWLTKSEISEDSYKEYRRMQKSESKRRERERKRAAAQPPQPQPLPPQPSPPPQPTPPPPTAASTASEGGAGSPPPRTPECSICTLVSAAFCCRCVGGFDTCPLCSRRVEAAVRFISP